jgi:hypothetical protein
MITIALCQSHQTGEWCVLSSLCREHYVSSISSCGFNYTRLIRNGVFNATFNSISAIPWRLVLLVEEIRKPLTCRWQTLSHNVVSIITRHHVLGTDSIGSCKSNYHTITNASKSIKNMEEVLNCQEHLQCKIDIPGRTVKSIYNVKLIYLEGRSIWLWEEACLL